MTEKNKKEKLNMSSREKLEMVAEGINKVFVQLLDLTDEEIEKRINIEKGRVYTAGFAISGDGDQAGEKYQIEIRVHKK